MKRGKKKKETFCQRALFAAAFHLHNFKVMHFLNQPIFRSAGLHGCMDTRVAVPPGISVCAYCCRRVQQLPGTAGIHHPAGTGCGSPVLC